MIAAPRERRPLEAAAVRAGRCRVAVSIRRGRASPRLRHARARLRLRPLDRASPRRPAARYRWSPRAGGWVTEHDDWMRTSRPGISVAGETTGVGGAEQAAAGGAARGDRDPRATSQRLDPAQAERVAVPLRRRLRRRRRLSAARPSSASSPPTRRSPRSPMTRRSSAAARRYTAGLVRSALAAHPHLGTADAVKLLTRAGMGPCQGRFCVLTVAALIAEQTGRTLAEVGSFFARPPAKPLPVWQLADAEAPPGMPAPRPRIAPG